MEGIDRKLGLAHPAGNLVVPFLRSSLVRHRGSDELSEVPSLGEKLVNKNGSDRIDLGVGLEFQAY
jgi:hypothetical protein